MQRPRRVARRGRVICAGAALSVVVVSASLQMAQMAARGQQPLPGLDLLTGPPGDADLRAIILEPTSPVLNLLDRAQEGVDRGDWKLAIDSLQRIVENPEGSVVPTRKATTEVGAVYEPVRVLVHRAIASLPPEGLRAYRVLFDGRAKGIFERARDSHDISGLREVARHYLLTSFGDDAADLLASRLLDAGDPAGAERALRLILDIVPDSDVPRTTLLTKLAAARVLQGFPEDAARIVQDLKAGRDDLAAELAWIDRLSELPSVAALPQADPIPADWPTRLGPPNALGRMQPVAPSLGVETPWVFSHPFASSSSTRGLMGTQAEQPLRLSQIYPVAEGGKLFIRQYQGVIALDLDELRPVWSYPLLSSDGGLTSAGAADLRRSVVRWAAENAVQDSVGVSLTAGAGLVFFIERSGTGDIPASEADPEQAAAADPQNAARRTRSWSRPSLMNRLVAVSSGSGEEVWSRGRTSNPQDLLGGVEFLAPPIERRGALWTPMIDRTDVYLAGLRPTDGSVIDRILLCSLAQTPTFMGQAAPIFADEDVAIVSTNLGGVFAVDLAARELIWAHVYGEGPDTLRLRSRVHRGRRRTSDDQSTPFTRQWLPSAPLASGGRVFVTPIDSEELLAFASADGALLWAVPADGASYLMAADAESVWLGGRMLRRVDGRSGETIWEHELSAVPTGRAVVAGPHVFAPTSEGLVSLDAAAGTVLPSAPEDAPSEPLGHLLALNESIYSVHPTSVHRYPDVERTYARAVEEFEQQPGSPAAALRLAWMELLRGNPERAESLLRQLPGDAIADRSDRAEYIAHVRVEALTEMSKRAEPDLEAAMALQRRAAKVALSEMDGLRCALRIADLSAKRGDVADAYRTLYDLGTSETGDQTVELEDHVLAKARVGIGRRLRAISDSLSPNAVEELRRDAFRTLTAASDDLGDPWSRRRATATLVSLAELASPTEVAVDALLRLADDALAKRRYELASGYLAEARRLNPPLDMNLEIDLRACESLSRMQIGASPVDEAAACIERLGQAHAAEPLPTGFREIVAEGPDDPPETIAAWAARTRNMLREQAEQATSTFPAQVSRDASVGRLFEDTAWVLEARRSNQGGHIAPFEIDEPLLTALDAGSNVSPPKMLHLKGDGERYAGNRALFHAQGDVVFCLRASDGALLWSTVLDLPQEFRDQVNIRDRRFNAVMRTAAVDGQIVVLNGVDGIFGVGLMTGRKLWVQPYEIPGDPETAPARDATIASDQGLVVAMPRVGRLSAMRTTDGSLVWERDLLGERIRDVRIVGDAVVAVGSVGRRVSIFDLASGELRKRVNFYQADMEGGLMPIVSIGDVVAGPDRSPLGDEITAYRLSDGQEAWRVKLDKPLGHLFSVEDDYLGVGLLGGDVLLLDPANGEVMIDHSVKPVSTVYAVRFEGTTMYVAGESVPNRYTFSILSALDIATGEQLWQRDQISLLPGSSGEIPIVGGLIPVAIREPVPGNTRIRTTGVHYLDARTGESRGPVGELLTNRSADRLTEDFVVIGDTVVTGTTQRVIAFSVPQDEGGS